jgi:hypothetical protein
MARATLKQHREPADIGQAIIAAWFKVLPNSGTSGGVLTDAIKDELATALREILATPFEIEIDPPAPTDASPLKIVVPQPPTSADPALPNVRNRQELINYLDQYHQYSQGRHYHEDLGIALVFGCGK